MPPIYPDVNGNRTAFCDLRLGVAGVPIKGIKSISYDEDHEIPFVYGTDTDPIGRTAGRRGFTGNIEFYQAEWLMLLPVLTRSGLFGWAELSNVVTCAYATLLNPVDTITDSLIGVRLHAPKRSYSEGTDALTVNVSMSIMRMTTNRFEGIKRRP